MKKLLFLLLLIPLSISAKGIELNIECNTLKINDKISCDLVLTNDYNSFIKSVEINKNELLQNLKSDYDLVNENKLLININSDENKIDVISFEYFMDKNDTNIYLANVRVNTNYNTYETNELVKNLKINNIAHVDNILVNNQPISDFDINKFNYVINLYELNDYVEIDVITDDSNEVDLEKKLFKSYNNNTISFSVTNKKDTEKYEIKFVYQEQNDNDKVIVDTLQKEIDRNKRYHYLEVSNNTSEFIINGERYNLVVGKNTIKYKNNIDTYLFIVNRLKPDEIIENDPRIKTLKIGNSYLNIKDDVYEYNYSNNKIDLVEIETFNNNDYEVKYNDDKITIIVYDAGLNSNEYVINLNDESEQEVKVEEYDKTKTVLVFLIFLLTFILLIIITIRKIKKNRIN